VRACSADEEPGDDAVLQVPTEAGRLAVDAELRDDCTQQPFITTSLHRRRLLRHKVSLQLALITKLTAVTTSGVFRGRGLAPAPLGMRIFLGVSTNKLVKFFGEFS